MSQDFIEVFHKGSDEKHHGAGIVLNLTDEHVAFEAMDGEVRSWPRDQWEVHLVISENCHCVSLLGGHESDCPVQVHYFQRKGVYTPPASEYLPEPAKGEGHPYEDLTSTVDLVSHLHNEHEIGTLMSANRRPITVGHLIRIHAEKHGLTVVDAADFENLPPEAYQYHPSGRPLSSEPMTFEQIVNWYQRASDGDYRVEEGRILRFTNGEWVEVEPMPQRPEYRLVARSLDESGEEDAHSEWWPIFRTINSHEEAERARDEMAERDGASEYRIEFRYVTDWQPTINLRMTTDKDDT